MGPWPDAAISWLSLHNHGVASPRSQYFYMSTEAREFRYFCVCRKIGSTFLHARLPQLSQSHSSVVCTDLVVVLTMRFYTCYA